MDQRSAEMVSRREDGFCFKSSTAPHPPTPPKFTHDRLKECTTHDIY